MPDSATWLINRRIFNPPKTSHAKKVKLTGQSRDYIVHKQPRASGVYVINEKKLPKKWGHTLSQILWILHLLKIIAVNKQLNRIKNLKSDK